MKDIKIIPIIPSLNPDKKLITYVNQLIKVGFKKIIIVNDGSSKKYDKYFDELTEKKECTVLKHTVNQGKGRALKTAFNYYLENFSNYGGIVTADSDGQHSAKDTYNVALELVNSKNALVLGTRNFNEKNVPFRSKFGNKTTTLIFKLLYGKQINDTQTGLRGLSNDFIKVALSLTGERFEYEINMLISAVKEKINIKEVIINTIYIDENSSSHFDPLKDSIRIYKVMFSEFLKFTFSGIFSFVIDILLFYIFTKFFFNGLEDKLSIILSTIVARIISSLINFNLNKIVVFNSNESNKSLLIKYYSLCLIQMMASALLTSVVFSITFFTKTISKIIVDLFLFIISYNIQRKFIFKRK